MKYLDEDGLEVIAQIVNQKLKVVDDLPLNPSNGNTVFLVTPDTHESYLLQYRDLTYFNYYNSDHNMGFYTTTQEFTWEMKLYYDNGSSIVPYNQEYGLDYLDPDGQYFNCGVYIDEQYMVLRFDYNPNGNVDGSDWFDVAPGVKSYSINIYRYMYEDVVKDFLLSQGNGNFILSVQCDYDWGTDIYWCTMGWYHPPGDRNYRYWTLSSGTMVYQFHETWNGELNFSEYNLINPVIEGVIKAVSNPNELGNGEKGIYVPSDPDEGSNYIKGGLYEKIRTHSVNHPGQYNYLYIKDEDSIDPGIILYNEYGLPKARITNVDTENNTFDIRNDLDVTDTFAFSDVSENADYSLLFLTQAINSYQLPSPSSCTTGTILSYTGTPYNDGSMNIVPNHSYIVDYDEHGDYIFIDIDGQYTTYEQFTGKYWIDGKPIYRMGYEGALSSVDTSNPQRLMCKYVMSGVDCDSVISAVGWVYTHSTAVGLQKVMIGSSAMNASGGFQSSSFVFVDENHDINIVFEYDNEFSPQLTDELSVVVEYTKN